MAFPDSHFRFAFVLLRAESVTFVFPFSFASPFGRPVPTTFSNNAKMHEPSQARAFNSVSKRFPFERIFSFFRSFTLDPFDRLRRSRLRLWPGPQTASTSNQTVPRAFALSQASAWLTLQVCFVERPLRPIRLPGAARLNPHFASKSNESTLVRVNCLIFRLVVQAEICKANVITREETNDKRQEKQKEIGRPFD